MAALLWPFPAQEHQTSGRADVLHSLMEPAAFDLVRWTMDSLMPGSLDSGLLNREAGFSVGSDCSLRHGDPDRLNAGLHHLLLLCWRCQRTGKALRAEALPRFESSKI